MPMHQRINCDRVWFRIPEMQRFRDNGEEKQLLEGLYCRRWLPGFHGTSVLCSDFWFPTILRPSVQFLVPLVLEWKAETEAVTVGSSLNANHLINWKSCPPSVCEENTSQKIKHYYPWNRLDCHRKKWSRLSEKTEPLCQLGACIWW